MFNIAIPDTVVINVGITITNYPPVISVVGIFTIPSDFCDLWLYYTHITSFTAPSLFFLNFNTFTAPTLNIYWAMKNLITPWPKPTMAPMAHGPNPGDPGGRVTGVHKRHLAHDLRGKTIIKGTETSITMTMVGINGTSMVVSMWRIYTYKTICIYIYM